MGSLPETRYQIERLETLLNVDVDSMLPEVAQSLPFKPHDMTSNQLLINETFTLPKNKELFLQAVREYKDQGWEKILDRISVLLCAANIGNLRGRVLVQTSPRNAYDTEKILAHARSYAEEFEKVGISKDRFCIKIPCTGPALNAVPILKKEGIRALGTSLFGLPQAIAASQAGCLYISPYFNEVKAHADLSLWPDVEDPATQHTMAPRMVHILETYKRLAKETGKEQPLVKSASFISAKETFACAEMGAQYATISAQVLADLCKTPDNEPVNSKPKPMYDNTYVNDLPTPDRLRKLMHVDPLASADWDRKLASTDIDYLANNGAELDKANNADPIVRQRLHEALELFKGGEMRSKAEIEQALAQA